MSFEHTAQRAGMRLLKRKQVLVKLGISSATLYSWMDAGRLPRPVQLGPNTVRWIEQDLDAAVMQLAQERDLPAGAE